MWSISCFATQRQSGGKPQGSAENWGSRGADVMNDIMLVWLLGGTWMKKFGELSEYSSIWILQIEAWQSRTIRHSTCGDGKNLQVHEGVCQP